MTKISGGFLSISGFEIYRCLALSFDLVTGPVNQRGPVVLDDASNTASLALTLATGSTG
jgi:hypothetical protein